MYWVFGLLKQQNSFGKNKKMFRENSWCKDTVRDNPVKNRCNRTYVLASRSLQNGEELVGVSSFGRTVIKYAIGWRSVDRRRGLGRLKNEKEIAVPKRRGKFVYTDPVLLCIRSNGNWVSDVDADPTKRSKVALKLIELF